MTPQRLCRLLCSPHTSEASLLSLKHGKIGQNRAQRRQNRQSPKEPGKNRWSGPGDQLDLNIFNWNQEYRPTMRLRDRRRAAVRGSVCGVRGASAAVLWCVVCVSAVFRAAAAQRLQWEALPAAAGARTAGAAVAVNATAVMFVGGSETPLTADIIDVQSQRWDENGTNSTLFNATKHCRKLQLFISSGSSLLCWLFTHCFSFFPWLPV